MKLSELVKALEELKEKYGDVEVREAQNGEYEFNIEEICGEIFIG